MIIHNDENIKSIKKSLENFDFKKIEKDSFIERDKNGWGIHTLKKQIEVDCTSIIIFSLPPKTYIAHKHLTDLDEFYYHLIINTNNDCGIIVENECLFYSNNLIFGFDPRKKHIVWNNGDTIRDSLVFIYKNKNISYEYWIKEKMRIANKEYEDCENISMEEIKETIKKFKINLNT
jgi:hypothetical protein